MSAGERCSPAHVDYGISFPKLREMLLPTKVREMRFRPRSGQ